MYGKYARVSSSQKRKVSNRVDSRYLAQEHPNFNTVFEAQIHYKSTYMPMYVYLIEFVSKDNSAELKMLMHMRIKRSLYDL